MQTIKDLKQGDYFKITVSGEVYVKGEYVRKLKKYSCSKFNDLNSERFFKGDKMVITNFEF